MAGIVEEMFKKMNYKECYFLDIKTCINEPVAQFFRNYDTDNTAHILIKRLYVELKKFLNETNIDYKDMKSYGKIILLEDNNIIANIIYNKNTPEYLPIPKYMLNPITTSCNKKVILI